MKFLVIVLIGFLFLSTATISYAIDVENPLIPYMDSGDGRGVNPGDPTPTKSPAQQASEKQKKNIAEILNELLNGVRTNVTVQPQQSPTRAITGNPTGTNENPTPTYAPAMEANTEETQYADTVVSIIRQNCFSNPTTRTGAGIVTYLNRDCLNSLVSVMNQKGIAEHYASPNNKNSSEARYYLQCVACARGMAAARGRDYNGLGNAAQHIGENGESNVSGYTYFTNSPSNYQQLIPGSLGVSNQNHIWYITDVQKDTSTGQPVKIRAYECNFGAKGLVRHDHTYDVDSIYFTGWQKPNNL